MVERFDGHFLLFTVFNFTFMIDICTGLIKLFRKTDDSIFPLVLIIRYVNKIWII